MEEPTFPYAVAKSAGVSRTRSISTCRLRRRPGTAGEPIAAAGGPKPRRRRYPCWCARSESARADSDRAYTAEAGQRSCPASAMYRDDQRDDQDRHDVRDLDHRVDRGARRVLVRVADRVAGDRCGVRLRALAAVEAVLDRLLRVVPGAAARGHRDREEEPRDDRADEQAAEHLRLDDPDDDRDHDRDQR